MNFYENDLLIELEVIRHYVGFHIQMYVIGNIQIDIRRQLNLDVMFADGCDTLESYNYAWCDLCER